MKYIVPVLYVAIAAAANLIIAYFGTAAVLPTAFVFVGLTMVIRDYLHDEWQDANLVVRMSLLIIAGAVAASLINIDALRIAIASAAAFTVSETINAAVYQPMLRRGVPWIRRVNIGNLPNALTDSFVFLFIAFGWMPALILAQTLVKVIGGFIWSILFQGVRSGTLEAT